MPCPNEENIADSKFKVNKRCNAVIRNLIFYIIFYQPRCVPVYFAGLLVYLLWLIPPLLVLFLRRLLPSISCTLFDVLLFSNGLLGTHDRNIAPCGIICRGAMGVTVFWVCHKWNNREWWEWFVLLVYLVFEDIEEHPPDLELLL